MTDIPTTKATIQERNAAAFAAFDAVLAAVPADAWERPGTVGEWSLKDTLAHLASPWLDGQLEAYLDGREPTAMETFGYEDVPGPEWDLATNDGANGWRYTLERDLTLDEVGQRYADYRQRSDAVIARLPEDAFGREFTLLPLGHWGRLAPADATAPWSQPLWRWISGHTWHHAEDHLADFEAALARRAE